MKCKMIRHHRRCKSKGGQTVERNISIVTVQKHLAFHTLFCNRSAEEIAGYLTAVWIDPEWEMVARRKRNHHDPNQMTLPLDDVC